MGLPNVYYINHASYGKIDLYVFKWKSNNEHIIMADVYQNNKVEVTTVDDKEV